MFYQFKIKLIYLEKMFGEVLCFQSLVLFFGFFTLELHSIYMVVTIFH